MKTSTRRKTCAFLDGVTRAFEMAPAESLQAKYAIRQSPAERIQDAFAQVGAALHTSMIEVAREQERAARPAERV